MLILGGVSSYLLFYPPEALSSSQLFTLVIGLMAIGFWATALIPEYLTALLFFCACMLLSVAAPQQVFSGFSSSAFWLVYGGLIIGIAINKTGLGKRIATILVSHLDYGYSGLITGVVVIGILFSFLMPSAMARMVLLIPIMLLIASHFGFEHGTKGRTGIILAAIMGTFIPAFAILPANVANMVLSGLYESQFRHSFLYGEYLLINFPILGGLKAICIVGMVILLFPDKIRKIDDSELNGIEPWSKNEKFLTVLLSLALLLWITDFYHHISPAWIAILVAIILLFPKIAIVTSEEFSRQINYASLLFVAGVIGFGVVISHSGLGNILAEYLLDTFPLDKETPFINYMLLSLSSVLTALAVTSPSVPAILMPLAEPITSASGLPLKMVIMTQVIGFSTTIFPYQTVPILIAMQMAGEKLSHAVKFCFLLALLTLAILVPVNYFWWRFLERIGAFWA